MLVSVSGYNFTGSGAVFDLLKEYEDVSIVSASEIAFVYLPDGLIDLDYHVNHSASYLNGDVAIHRFWNLCKKCGMPRDYREQFLAIAKEYLNEIVSTAWQGFSAFDDTRLEGISYVFWRIKRWYSIILYHFFKRSPAACSRTMYLAYHSENFSKATEKFLDRVAGFGESKGKNISVFNQFFSASQPELSMKYAKDAKTIVVERDPRDVFILGKMKRETSCYPYDNVKSYVEYFMACQGNADKAESERVLRIQFEDLIYHYDDTVQKIEKFLGIKKHVRKKQYFKPEVSVNNTQLKERFPQMKEDIAYIEGLLEDDLYCFPVIRKGEGDFF